MKLLSKAVLPARAEGYRLLSRLYARELDAPLLTGLRGAATGIFAPLAGALDEAPEVLRADFAGLFLAAGSADGKAAIPCESLYVGGKHLFFGAPWEDMDRRIREAGLAPSGDLMADHLAVELEFMAQLVETGTPEAQLEFLTAHLQNWLPRLAADMRALAQTDFYRALAQVTTDFLTQEQALLEAGYTPAPSFSVRQERFAAILARLRERYRVFAPVRVRGAVRYGEVHALTDIVYKEKSHFSPKEVFYPISQTMFRFTDTDCADEPLSDEREILLFLRPCDLCAVGRLDNIFLHNGQPDLYYARLREKLKFVLLECREGFSNCFCASLGTNRDFSYDAAVRIDDICALFEICDEALLPYFQNEVPADFTPEFVRENARRITLPAIPDRAALTKIIQSPYWDKYNDTCIACGGCNTVCPTCSCFDTVDIIYNETSRDGERRRVWSSCMLRDFTRTAGGGMARKTQGAAMRFKVLHKVYDYKLRFGTTMCVGCGRCIDRCPEKIDYLDAVNGLAEEVAANA